MQKYVLQDCLGDLVSLFHDCCGFGIPVPLFCFIYVVRQSRFALLLPLALSFSVVLLAYTANAHTP